MVSSRINFNKVTKLVKTDDFSSVFNFRKRISSEHLVMHFQPNNLQSPRLGLVIGKKTAKLAVSRNYMRRVLREFFRFQLCTLPHVDLVVRAQKKFEKKAFIQIQKEFHDLTIKLNKRVSTLPDINFINAVDQ